MDSCDFCKMCWLTALAIGTMIGVFGAMNGLQNMGRDDVCWSAARARRHLDICDKSHYPMSKELEKALRDD